MRVLEVVREMHPRYGGPPRVVIGHVVQLKKRGIDVEIACMARKGEEAEIRSSWPELNSGHIPLHIFEYTTPEAIGRSASLEAFIERHVREFDVMHVHGIWEYSLAAAARSFQAAGQPYIISSHGMLDRWSMRQSAGKKWLARKFLGIDPFLRGADAIVFGTRDEAHEADDLKLPARQYIIPNGIEPALFERQRGVDIDGLYARFPAIAAWETVILFYSRLHPKKGLDLLIDALARIRHEYPNVGVFAAAIAEDDHYAAEIRRQIAAYGLENQVVLTTELTGQASRIVFNAADIFAMPSRQEGFSMAIIEAMAYGMPMLVTDACHMNDIAEWRSGKVVPVSVDGIEAGLRDLLEMDRAALAEMGSRGRNVAQVTFNWSRIGELLTEMLVATAAHTNGS